MPLWDLFWAMLFFFFFVIWLWLLFAVLGDIIRTDMAGWAKAMWAIFLIIVPYLGVLAYLVVYGGTMQDRSPRYPRGLKRAHEDYVSAVTGTYATGVSGWPSSAVKTY